MAVGNEFTYTQQVKQLTFKDLKVQLRKVTSGTEDTKEDFTNALESTRSSGTSVSPQLQKSTSTSDLSPESNRPDDFTSALEQTSTTSSQDTSTAGDRSSQSSQPEDFTTAMEQTSTTAPQFASTSGTSSTASDQQVGDFTSAMEQTSTTAPRPDTSSGTQTATSTAPLHFPFQIQLQGKQLSVFKELKVLQADNLNYKYQAVLSDGGILTGEFAIKPNVQFILTK